MLENSHSLIRRESARIVEAEKSSPPSAIHKGLDRHVGETGFSRSLSRHRTSLPWIPIHSKLFSAPNYNGGQLTTTILPPKCVDP